MTDEDERDPGPDAPRDPDDLPASEDDDGDAELDAREAARDRRRDRDRTARARGLMRTGLAKGFKQILDVQTRRAERAALADERDRSKPKAKDKDRRHP